MKKLIISALLVSAFSFGLFAKTVRMPIIEKNTPKLSAVVEKPKSSKKVVKMPVQECMDAPVPICDGTTILYFITIRFCAPTQQQLLELIASFACSGPNQQ